MSWDDLHEALGPRLQEAPPRTDLLRLLVDPGADADAAVRATLAREPGGAHFVIVQGRRCRTWPALLDHWAAALEFPRYYGRNRDAFDECLGDLLEIDGGLGHAFGDRTGRAVEVLAVHVAEADQLLADEEPGSLTGFLQQLAFCSDGTRVAGMADPPRLARLLVLLGVDARDADGLRRAAAG